MLTSLRLKNFKTWQDTNSIELGRVCMLLGTNSSGKSSLIQSLLLLKQTALSPDRAIQLNLGGDEASDYFHFGDFESVLKRGTSTPRQFEIAFSYRRPDKERVTQGAFSCSYGQTTNGSVVIQELSLSTLNKHFRISREKRGSYYVYVDNDPNEIHNGVRFAPERSIALSASVIPELKSHGSLLQDISLALHRELEGIIYLGPLRRKPERDYVWNKAKPGGIGLDGNRVADVLLASALLKGSDNHAIIGGVSQWLKRMGLADSLDIKQIGRSNRYELVVSTGGVNANLRDVGIGISQVLPVLTVAYSAPKGATILLEEPEIHLHPLAQSVLAELFVEVSQERDIQFIVETHSEHLFRRLQTLMAKGKTTNTNTLMYFVERLNGTANLNALDVDEFGSVKNWPINFFGDALGETRSQAFARIDRMRQTNA